MNFEKRIEGIKEWIDKEYYLEDSAFNKEALLEQEYLNFQIDDCYDYSNPIEGDIRDEIFKILFKTYAEWKARLLELKIPFYLGVWIYDPRLPKSEIVCAISKTKIDYYKSHCFDAVEESETMIDIGTFKAKKNELTWSQKIDAKTLEEWEINYPKENYESEKHWLKFQDYYKKFIQESYKTLTDKEEKKIYYKRVGSIWIGENINE